MGGGDHRRLVSAPHFANFGQRESWLTGQPLDLTWELEKRFARCGGGGRLSPLKEGEGRGGVGKGLR